MDFPITGPLIAKVKENEILYNTQHAEYKNVRLKDKVWDELGEQFHTSGYDLKKKWKNLRDTYAKYLRSTNSTSSSSHSLVKNYKKWQWAKHMEFMKNFSPPASTVATTGDSHTDDHQNEEEISVEMPENSPILPDFHFEEILSETDQDQRYLINREPKKELIDEPAANSLQESSNGVSDYFQMRHTLHLDATEYIFLGYAKTLKMFNPRRQAIVKLKIAQLIMEEELMHLDEVAGVQRSSTK